MTTNRNNESGRTVPISRRSILRTTGAAGALALGGTSLPFVTGVAGSSSALAAQAYQQSLPLSTAVFVVTVGLLYWRPSL